MSKNILWPKTGIKAEAIREIIYLLMLYRSLQYVVHTALLCYSQFALKLRDKQVSTWSKNYQMKNTVNF